MSVCAIPAIIGSTASGKTRFALRAHDACDSVRFVLCDSRKVYKFLDIGTAKPPKEVRHLFHLFDVRAPDEPYNAQEYTRDAEATIRELRSKDMPPVMVGGTPLYFRAFFEGFFESPDVSPEVRHGLREELRRKGNEMLYEELERVDPEAASKIHPNDWYRTSRALEVYRQFGVSITEMRRRGKGKRPFEPRYIGLRRPREKLYERINARVDRMMEGGLLEESRALLERGYDPSLPALNTLGYKEMFSHLRGEMSLDEAVRLTKKRTRVYSRKQMYYFQTFPDVRWVDPESEEALEVLKEILDRTLKDEESV
jgi:tRNA dimethylallyltransferase